MGSAGTESGYRWLRHTADLRIEAWAPSREKCVAEAVRGLVDCVVEATGDPVSTVEFEVGGETDEDLLVGVLDEVINRMDMSGQVPVTSTVRAGSRGLDVTCGMAELAKTEPVVSVPKPTSLHGLQLSKGPNYWSCALTVTV